MRIIISTGLYPPEIGGPATYTKVVEEELKRRGTPVLVLPFRLVRHLPPVIRHLAFMYRLIRMSKRGDILYAQDTVSVGLPTALVATLFRRRFFVRVPGDFAWEQGTQRFGVKEGIDDFQNKEYGFRVSLLRALQRFVVARAEKVITPSLYFKNLVSGWVNNPDKVHHIYNGINLNQKVVPHMFQNKTLVASGRLVPWKGFDSLINFVAETDFDLVILGEGEDRVRLESLVQEKNLGQRVSLPGLVSREELLAYSAGSFAVIAPSSFESFSFQIVEAMSVGAVCIAFDIGNLNEIITNGVSGYLVQPGDYDAVRTILNNLENVRGYIGENARKESQAFSVESTVDQLLNSMNVTPRTLMISTDRNIFDEESAVFRRMQDYSRVLGPLDIVVFTGRGFSKKTVGKVSLHPTNSSSRWLYPLYGFFIARKLRNIKRVTTQDPFETGIIGFFLSWKYRWSVQIHTDFMSPFFQTSFLNKVRVIIARLILRRAHSIRVVSERIKASIPTSLQNKKITVLPIMTEEPRARISIEKKDTLKLLTISRLEEEKNIDVLIRAVAGIPEVTLDIVGSGSLEDELRRLISTFHLEDRVFLRGFSHDTDSWYQNADVYIQASSYEGFGLSLFEAGLSGLPIVTTDVGLIGYEIPKDAVLVFSHKNHEELKARIEVLLSDLNLRETLSERVYEVSHDQLVSYDEYLEAYKNSL
jgi:glycosyltransferase involved in cell wall biosynthesis